MGQLSLYIYYYYYYIAQKEYVACNYCERTSKNESCVLQAVLFSTSSLPACVNTGCMAGAHAITAGEQSVFIYGRMSHFYTHTSIDVTTVLST